MSDGEKPSAGIQTTKLMEPAEAAGILKRALRGWKGDLTVADAASRGALALRDAEAGLHELTAKYHGHLAATDKGELVFKFPGGLVDPPEKRWWRRGLRRIGKTVGGVGRFVVRAWVSVVLIGYVLVFAAILIGLAMRKDGDNDSGIGDMIPFLFRGVFEALFWTFHPFSPFYLQRESRWTSPRLHGRRRRPREPFYEKVNRFVFGPSVPPPDPRENLRALLATIRRREGRIGLTDVARVTGLERGEADAQMSRLLLDYNGEVDVTDEGAIIYRFPELRQTAEENDAGQMMPAPFWRKQEQLPAITGNTGGFNFFVAALNGFNFMVSSWALLQGMTIERLTAFLAMLGQRPGDVAVVMPPVDGLPWALGVIPFVFSSAVFALPLVRVFRRRLQKRKVQAENGRRSLAEHVLEAPQAAYSRLDLEAVWAVGAGRNPRESEIFDAVRGLGGSIDVNDEGAVFFKFDELVREHKALTSARAEANLDEASPGRVVFSTD